MVKQAKPKTDRDRASTVKAGRGKNYIEPPLPNTDRKASSEMGDSQFVSKDVLTSPETRLILKNNTFKYVTKNVSVRYDWDPTRKHIITNPHFKEKEK